MVQKIWPAFLQNIVSEAYQQFTKVNAPPPYRRWSIHFSVCGNPVQSGYKCWRSLSSRACAWNRWPVQRVGIRRCDPASVDGLNNMWSLWMGIKAGQEIFGSVTILWPILLHNIFLRLCDPCPEFTFSFSNVCVLDIEWAGSANHSSFHPLSGKW